ncbi:MAG TPA: serine/threonine-protein kinase [Thermoleophilaceae bacterium]
MSKARQIEGYRIEGVAGRGGWSVVHRAVEVASGRRVALKTVAPELSGDPGFRERFRRECVIAGALDHPNVPLVLSAGDGWAAMEWIDGASLRELLPLEPARAARIVAQVADALVALHEAGFVHRDVKPGNVLVGAGDHAYLTDFGIAKPIDPDPGLTAEGRWLGHVDYAPPEQIRGEPADERSDVYALGATLFHAVTGSVPFPRDGDAAKMRAHLHEPPPAHDSPLDPVVRRALAKDPAERYPTAAKLAKAVRRA